MFFGRSTPRTYSRTLTNLRGHVTIARVTNDDSADSWDGWATDDIPPEGADGLHMRWRQDDAGRWVVSDLYLHGPALTANVLREISLARMEAWENAKILPEVRVTDSDEGLTVAELRQRAQAAPVSQREAAAIRPPEPITRPDGSDPDGFYRRVATAYRRYAIETKAPARAIAEEAQVPVTTVHRWVREARIRGFLLPGRKGKVG